MTHFRKNSTKTRLNFSNTEIVYSNEPRDKLD